jgi:hypothetical protein
MSRLRFDVGLVLAAASVAASCGCMGRADHTLSAAVVAKALRDATGLGFTATSSVDLPLIDTPMASVEPSDAAHDRFGEFTIVVYGDPEAAEHQEVFKRNGKLEAGKISWEFWPADHGTPAAWAATTRYGSVRLVWRNTVREVDDRWRVLDRALSECCK